MRNTSFTLSLLAVACATPPSTDTGVVADSGAGDAVDTADSAGEEDTSDLRFLLDGDWGDATLTLTWLDLAQLRDDNELRVGDTLLSAPAAADLALVVPAPPEADLVEIDPENFPGSLVAAYVPALHRDLDGDGVRSGDEFFLGTSNVVALWVSGTPRDGLQPGWNALLLTRGGDPLPTDRHAIPVSTNLEPALDGHLAGTAPDALADARFALVSVREYVGDQVLDDVWGAPASSPWAADVSGAPPDDHVTLLGNLGFTGALERLVAYDDLDGDGGYSPGDAVRAGACVDGEPVALLWAPEVPDLAFALTLVLHERAAGWIPVATGVSAGPLLDSDAETLDFDEGCAP